MYTFKYEYFNDPIEIKRVGKIVSICINTITNTFINDFYTLKTPLELIRLSDDYSVLNSIQSLLVSADIETSVHKLLQ